MIPTKNICSLCSRPEVKFYDLQDSIKAPSDLRFKGYTNLQAALEKVLNKTEKYRKATNEICQNCSDKMHEIYSFTHQYTESEKIFHQIKDVTVRLKKLKTFLVLTDLKTEFEASAEIDKDMDSLEYNATVCDNSAVSSVVVKMECDNNFKDSIDFNKVSNDLNIGLLGGKYSNTADSKSFDQTNIDSMDSEDMEQITIKDEIIKEEWIMQEDSIFETTPNHDVLDGEQTKSRHKPIRGSKHQKLSHTDVTKHPRRDHPRTLFSCDHCDGTYTSKQTLKEHKERIKGILFYCDQCDAKYKTRGSLRDHKMSHTGVTFACNKCEARFSNKRGLTDHLRGIHPDAEFACDLCDATYKRRRSLNEHKLIHKGISFNCVQCDAKFKSRGGLRYHKKSHSELPFACNKCDTSFSIKESLTKHLREVHTDAVFSCDHCHATYKTKRTLNVHKQIHN